MNRRTLRAAQWFARPNVQVWINGVLMVGWTVFLVLAPFIAFFGHSLLWITEISLWALVATHLGAWISALVNARAEMIQKIQEDGITLAHLNEHEEAIEAAVSGSIARIDRLDAAQREILSILRGTNERTQS